jgi:hypothetical protein
MSEGCDYFSEPGGYQTTFHQDYEAKWNDNDAVLRGDLWVNSFPRSWDGISKESEKLGDNSWVGDQRYLLPVLKENSVI